jgi:triosephosphate isomerase
VDSSLTPDNARAIFNMPDIDGGLVGRASLNAVLFSQICTAAGFSIVEKNGVGANKQSAD